MFAYVPISTLNRLRDLALTKICLTQNQHKLTVDGERSNICIF